MKEPQTKKIIIFNIIGSGLLFSPFSGAVALDKATKAIQARELDKVPF